MRSAALLFTLVFLPGGALLAQTDWPRWRGPDGNGVAADEKLPGHWDRKTNVAWSAEIPGAGASSPVIRGERLYVTSAAENGARRSLHCLDSRTGELRWTRTVEDEAPELSSSVTGHAASTPAAGGDRAVAFFGNAGVVCCDAAGNLVWRRPLGEFDTELGIATSPVIHAGRIYIVCDHDGSRPRSFDSFLAALDLGSGEVLWRSERPGLYRSWSTPIVVPAPGGGDELVVCGQDEVRGHDPAAGTLLWRIRGLKSWVVPSPVTGGGLIFAASGPDGMALAARPGGRGDVTASHVVWKDERAGAYVPSPVFHDGRLYLLRENGVLTCLRAATGERLYRERLAGKFTASPIAGAGKLYFAAEDGATYVVAAGDVFRQVARNELGEYTIASPAAAGGRLFLRTEKRVYCIAEDGPAAAVKDPPAAGAAPGGPAAAGAAAGERPESAARAEKLAVDYLAREVPQWVRAHRCFSCHNNGDGARALFAARALSLEVPDEAWKDTSAWLLAPESWSARSGSNDYDDPELARIQFAAALLAGTESGALGERPALERAAAIVARAQGADGSWRGGSAASVGTPTAYSRHLATHFARALLVAARSPAHEEPIRRAGEWLRKRAPENVHQAAVLLLAADAAGGFPGETRLAEALALIRAGRSRDGGWGPYANSSSEVFDSALVLLGLARLTARLAAGAEAEAGKEKAAEIEAWIRGGRAYLLETQEPAGCWPATTRPSGAESYAQRVSTTAWAVLALLATR